MIDNVIKILEKNLCNHCLGRQFSQLLSGYKNEERGKIIRNFTAMLIDGKLIDYSKINPNNFYGFKFRQNKEFAKNLKKEKCWLCNNLFDKSDSLAKKAVKKLKKIEFNNFLVGNDFLFGNIGEGLSNINTAGILPLMNFAVGLKVIAGLFVIVLVMAYATRLKGGKIE